MSHQVKTELQFKDEAALEAACAEMGLTLARDAEARQYGGNTKRFPLVVKLRGPYDIGLKQGADGNWEASTDWWQGHVASEVGENYGRLKQAYGQHAALARFRKKGYFVHKKLSAAGNPLYVVTGGKL